MHYMDADNTFPKLLGLRNFIFKEHLGTVSMGKERLIHLPDHSPPFGAEVKNEWR